MSDLSHWTDDALIAAWHAAAVRADGRPPLGDQLPQDPPSQERQRQLYETELKRRGRILADSAWSEIGGS